MHGAVRADESSIMLKKKIRLTLLSTTKYMQNVPSDDNIFGHCLKKRYDDMITDMIFENFKKLQIYH